MERLHDPDLRGFASDNYAGTHPEVLAALAAANGGHLTAYGGDPYSDRLQALVRHHFGPGAEAFPVFNGTGANVVALQSLVPRWAGVVCAATAHIHTDENGAPERVGGLKLLPVPTPDGRLTPELLDEEAWGYGNVHRAQPLAVSVTQSTELGTTYRPDALAALCHHAHRLGLAVHLDGARLANAAAFLGTSLGALTTDLGVDVVSFGGTKNGLVLGEAIVVCNPDAVHGLSYLRKTSMQLASKSRFLSAQLVALLEDDLWRRSAQAANAMAARLRAGLDRLPGVTCTQPTEANTVLAVLPPGVADAVRERYAFYDWDRCGTVRLMCAFDTTDADVDGLLAAIRTAIGAGTGADVGAGTGAGTGADVPGGVPAGRGGTMPGDGALDNTGGRP